MRGVLLPLALLGALATAYHPSAPAMLARGRRVAAARRLVAPPSPRLARTGRPPVVCLGRAAQPDVGTHIVWYTGCADLRVHDHGGLLAAAACGARCIPVFVLDDQIHLDLPEPLLRRLHAALVGLDDDLDAAYGGRLVYREGCAARLLVELARETRATVCHVVADEITFALGAQRRAARAALDKAGVELRMWTTNLRQDAPWSSRGAALTRLPPTYAEYYAEARELPLTPPAGAPDSLVIGRAGKDGKDGAADARERRSDIPSCGTIFERADALARRAARARATFPTTEPFDHVVQAWVTTASARAALDEYLAVGRDAFADRHFFEAMPLGMLDDDDDDDEDAATVDGDSGVDAVGDAALVRVDDDDDDDDAAADAGERSATTRDARRGVERELVGAARSARAPAAADVGELRELREGGMRVGMGEPPVESGMPRGPRAAGFGSVESIDRLVPLDDEDAADLRAEGVAPRSRVADDGGSDEMVDDEVDGEVFVALSPPSLHAAAAQWLLPHVPLGGLPPRSPLGGANAGAARAARSAAAAAVARGVAAERPRRGAFARRMAMREVATRALAPALSLGSLSAREVAQRTAEAAAEAAARGELERSTLSGQAWGRSEMGAVMDILEWREWHRLLARRDLEAQRQQTTSGYYDASARSAAPPSARAVAPAPGAAVAVVADGGAADRTPAAAETGGDGGVTGATAGAAAPPASATSAVPAVRPSALTREQPAFGYWRWGGQHLVRFAVWPSDADVAALDGSGGAHVRAGADGEPLCLADALFDALVAEHGAERGAERGGEREGGTHLLFVHGFGASCEQWSRLARELRAQLREARLPVPRMYAIDMLGFGHSEKPGLSYTQHLWEAQLFDFALEVMGARPFIAVGNSIGGGLAAGLAANLKPLCKGLVLCNSAGRIDEPAEYAKLLAAQQLLDEQARGARATGRAAPVTVGSATLRVRDHPTSLGEVYAPPPFGGQPLLDAFGYALIRTLIPQVGKLLRSYYPAQPEAVDTVLIDAIVRDGLDPGAPNVIASGQKLPPQRPLNEVLSAELGFGGPVLVPQGALDPLSGAERSQTRAAQLGRLRPGVSVRLLEAGHCPHDEVPEQVAAAIVEWWPPAALVARS